MLTLALGACTNDYGSFDFSGATEGAEAGPNGSGGETASTGGAGAGTGGSSGGDASVGMPESGAGGTAVDASPEAGIPDAFADVGSDGLVDSGAHEASAPDGSGDAAPSCTDRYGSAAGFTLCAQRSTTCSFAAQMNGDSCRVLCESLGGTCLGALDNGMTPCRPRSSSDDCDTVNATEICTCSR
jgi:hypothetical protein